MVELKSELEEQVRQALADDERTEDAEITVEDDDGVITLAGTVADRETREAAEEITEQVEGVVEIISDLEIAAEEEIEGVAGIAPHPPNQ